MKYSEVKAVYRYWEILFADNLASERDTVREIVRLNARIQQLTAELECAKAVEPVAEEIANDPWSAMQVASLKSYLAEQARISAVERALLATVAGDGNEYMVHWTYGGEAFLIMTRHGRSNHD